ERSRGAPARGDRARSRGGGAGHPPPHGQSVRARKAPIRALRRMRASRVTPRACRDLRSLGGRRTWRRHGGGWRAPPPPAPSAGRPRGVAAGAAGTAPTAPDPAAAPAESVARTAGATAAVAAANLAQAVSETTAAARA